MKKYLAAGLLLLTTLSSSAQKSYRSSDGSQRNMGGNGARLNIDLGTGINANTALLGGGLDYHFTEKFSMNAGVGLISSWGNKVYLGAKAYTRPGHEGWAFGGGLTYNTGISEFVSEQETIYKTREKVTLDLLPQTCVFLSSYKYWRIGQRNNRFFLQLGWSRSVNAVKFKQVSGTPVSSNSAAVTRFISPGGLVIGIGFSFGT